MPNARFLETPPANRVKYSIFCYNFAVAELDNAWEDGVSTRLSTIIEAIASPQFCFLFPLSTNTSHPRPR